MKRTEFRLAIPFLSTIIVTASACSGSSNSFRSTPVAANGGSTPSGSTVTLQAAPVPPQTPASSSGFTDPFPPASSVAQPVQSASDILLDLSQFALHASAMPGSTSVPAPNALKNGLTKGISVEMWFKNQNWPSINWQTSSNSQTGIGFGVFGNINVSNILGNDTGAIYLKLNQELNGGFQGSTGWAYGMNGPFDDQDGNVHHYVMTNDIHNFRMYIDGELVLKNWDNSSVDQIGPVSDDLGTVYPNLIANNPTLDPNTFVRITQRPLTPYEVRRNFESSRPTVSVTTVNSNATLLAALSTLGPSKKIVIAPGTYSGSSFVIPSGTSCGGPLTSCLITGQDGSVPPTISSVSAGDTPTITSATGIRLQNIQFTSSVSSLAALRISGSSTRIVGNALRIQSAAANNGIGIDASSLTSGSNQVMIENSQFQMTGGGSPVSMQIANINRFTFRQNTIAGGATGLLIMPTSDDVGLLNNIFSGQTTSCLNFQSGTTSRYIGDGNVYSPTTGAQAVTFATAPSYTNGSTFNFSSTFAPADVSSELLNSAWYAEDYTDNSDSLSYRISHSQEGRSFGGLSLTFGNPSAGNFLLSQVPGNPIDAGVSETIENQQKLRTVAAGVSDITGSLRPRGGQVDPGAYENFPSLAVAANVSGSNILSAGVYNSAGNLIRTILTALPISSGVSTIYWNGLDDFGNVAPNGSYTIKSLATAETTTWLGVVGSNSNPAHGPAAFGAFGAIPVQMAFWGTTGFYTLDYNEASRELFTFNPANPVQNLGWFGPGAGTNSNGWNSIDTDGTYLYGGNADGIGAWDFSTYDPNAFVDNNGNGMTYEPVNFPNGAQLSHTPNYVNSATNVHPNGILIGTGSGESSTGPYRSVAVQKVSGDNLVCATTQKSGQVSCFNKLSGAAGQTISIPGAHWIATDPADDSLWVLTQKDPIYWPNVTPTLYKYLYNSSTQTYSATSIAVTGYNGFPFSSPVTISVFWTPGQGNAKVIVADGGISNQVDAFDTNGNDAWVFGTPGGYLTGGPAVTNTKWGFSTSNTNFTSTGSVAAQPDGSFWVMDSFNARSLHFDKNQNYLNQMDWSGATYTTAVDVNDATRVFNGYREYKVDYTKPLGSGWTLVRNWGYQDSTGTPLPSYASAVMTPGFASVATMPNGKTYAAMWVQSNMYQLVELDPNLSGLRFISGSGISIQVRVPPTGSPYTYVNSTDYVWSNFKFTQGSTHWAYSNSSTSGGSPVQNFNMYNLDFSGGDPVSVPMWGGTSGVNVNFSTSTSYPGLYSAFYDLAIRADGGISIFDTQRKDLGMHLGAVSPAGQIEMAVSPSHGGLNGLGNFDSSCQYGGAMHAITGNDIFSEFRGEYYPRVEAAQTMHYHDSGLFINQFGWVRDAGTFAQGGAGNVEEITASTYNGSVYLFTNDEDGRGVHVWQIGNMASTQILNQSVTVP